MKDQDVIALRLERKRGVPLKDLAKRYGVSEGHVSHIAAGHYHPNVGGPITEPPSTKTHCLRGHEYTPANTIIKKGCRNCRRCQNDLNNARRKQQRAEKRAGR